MPLFHFIGLDKPDSLELRASVRPEHLDYLKGSNKIRAAGALLDSADRPEGSVLIIEAENLEAAKVFADGDPFAKAGLFATTSLRPWRLAIGGVQGYAG